ncbi:MAG TPA: polymorphic toxin type 50 domain-containing protein [Dehalococcoidia bacterium]|nr:polymorphic toxin type 50 domain-containing protein [Dehalococcoidia bacterium]
MTEPLVYGYDASGVPIGGAYYDGSNEGQNVTIELLGEAIPGGVWNVVGIDLVNLVISFVDPPPGPGPRSTGGGCDERSGVGCGVRGGFSGPTRVPVQINSRQARHQVGSQSYSPGRSVLTHPDPKALLDKHAFTGQRVAGKLGEAGYRERVNFGEVIGLYNGTAPTTNGVIHWANDGAHIVPARP